MGTSINRIGYSLRVRSIIQPALMQLISQFKHLDSQVINRYCTCRGPSTKEEYLLISTSRRKDMDIVKEVKEILALRDSGEKDSRLSLLSGEFEYGDKLDKADVAEGTQYLLAA